MSAKGRKTAKKATKKKAAAKRAAPRSRNRTPASTDTTLSPEDREILRERARRLAQRDGSGAAEEAPLKLLVFELNAAHYAFDMRAVHEVVRGSRVTTVPGGPDAILGIANLRGSICPIVDLGHLFALAGGANRDPAALIYLKCPGKPIGVAVDRILGTRSYGTEDMGDAKAITAERLKSFTAGLMPDATVLLKADAVLDGVTHHAIPAGQGPLSGERSIGEE